MWTAESRRADGVRQQGLEEGGRGVEVPVVPGQGLSICVSVRPPGGAGAQLEQPWPGGSV